MHEIVGTFFCTNLCLAVNEVLSQKKQKLNQRCNKARKKSYDAKTECVVIGSCAAERYVVVFSREKVVSEAMDLKFDDHILLEGAYFRQPPKGRGSVEIHAKRFSRLK